jgi:hypothetical protein
MPEQIKEVENLLNKSVNLLDEVKTARKSINTMAKDSEKSLGADASIVKSCKDMYYTKGKAWVGNDPLTLDKDEKVKDKISPVFIKLRDIVVDLQHIGHIEWLQEYLSAIEGYGIHIKIDDVAPTVNDPAEMEEVIKSMTGYQKVISDNSEEIKEKHAQKAEDINFSPKKEYTGVVGLYSKLINKKDVDDAYQQKIADLESTETAYNIVYDTFNAKEDSATTN